MQDLGRTHRLIASLFGCVLLSGTVLLDKGGYKLCFKLGLEQKVRVFLTEDFKREAPALTMVLREACGRGRGWKAVTFAEARAKQGWSWGLVLRGKTENIVAAQARCKKLLCLTGEELVTWATREFVEEKESAWVKGSTQ